MINGPFQRIAGAWRAARTRPLPSKKKFVFRMAAFFAVSEVITLGIALLWFWSKIERDAGISLAEVFGHRPWVWVGLGLAAFCWLAFCGALLGLLLWRISDPSRRPKLDTAGTATN